jgi:hypothetical protein
MLKKNNVLFNLIEKSNVWILILLVTFLSITLGKNNSNSNDPNLLSPDKLQKISEIERQITTSATLGFKSSFEMKENTDFLLTPALLVHEAISDDILITYPTE